MKLYIICGERSGDQHAAALVEHLKLLHNTLDIHAVGGNALEQLGVTITHHYSLLNYMGLMEVAKNIFKVQKTIHTIKLHIKTYQPDCVICVDSYGLNKQIAEFCKTISIPVIYYIAPKIWAWNSYRAHDLKKLFAKIFVILPFEKNFYDQYHIPVEYSGNPSYQSVNTYLDTHNNSTNQSVYFALLPGSRIQEINNVIEHYSILAESYPNFFFKVAAVSSVPREIYTRISHLNNVELVFDDSFNVLSGATAAVVVSGTATLETALFEVPQVVVYRANWLTILVARFVIKVPFISLVNLVAEKEVVKELIQEQCTSKNIASELLKLLPGSSVRDNMILEYKKIKEALGNPNASQVAAAKISEFLKTL